MEKVKACVVQACTIPNDTPATVAKAVGLIQECARRGGQVAVFPEAFIGGYPKGANFDIVIGKRSAQSREEYATYAASAIEVPGPQTELLASAAKDANIFVTIGVIERDGGTLYCTALFFGPNGLLGKHRKVMPTAAERLCWGFGDGSTLTAVSTPWGNMGAVICWENYMPLMRMAMFNKNLTFYCAPTADDRDSWAASMRHVALEGRCFVLSACQYLTRADFPNGLANHITDDSSEVLMRGGSMIVNALGEVVAGPDFSGETILTADLDLRDIPRAKFDLDVTGHYARPDIFKLRVDESERLAVVTEQFN